MANVITTETAILNQVVAELQTLNDANAGNVFIAAQTVWLAEPPGDFYLEVIPGVAIDKWAKQGNGWIKDSFTVCVFKRLIVDMQDQDTAKIADASVGLLKLIDDVQTKLTLSYLAGKALVPILPERREAGERNPDDPYDGWIMMRRTFVVEYLYAVPALHSTS
jgi:hypothetical protein